MTQAGEPAELRVVRVLTRPNLGGPMQQAIALWHAHRALGVRTLLVTGTCENGETPVDPAAHGIPVLTFDDVLRQGGAAAGAITCPALRRRPHVVRDLVASRWLRAVLRAVQPHVVHTHTTKAGLLGRRAAVRARVPVVAHTFHGHVLRDYYGGVMATWLQRMETRLARRTDLLFAVSPSCRRELAELQVAPSQRLEVVPPAVDVQPFREGSRRRARRLLGVDDDRVLLAFVGRLVPIKRPDLFQMALELLPEAEGHVFGDGPLRGELSARAGSRLHLHGSVPDLPRYLKAFDALLLPSEREGAPLAAIEAFAAGVPVIGFDVPGVVDVLEDWGAGVVVPRQLEATGLARAVRHLLADEARRDDVVLQARGELERFLPHRVAESLLARYREALGARAAVERGSTDRGSPDDRGSPAR